MSPTLHPKLYVSLKWADIQQSQRNAGHLEVVGFMSEHFRGHVSVAASLACQLELRVQVIPSMLIHRQRFAQPKICQLDGASVKYQIIPAARKTNVSPTVAILVVLWEQDTSNDKAGAVYNC